MYKISLTGTGSLIGIAEKLTYVHFDAEHNVYVAARDAQSADGIAFGGKLYNINGVEKIQGAPFAQFVEVDTGEFITDEFAQVNAELAETNAALDEIIITMLEG